MGVASNLSGVSRMAMSPNGMSVAALSAMPAQVSVIDVTSHRTTQRLRLPLSTRPVGASFLPNGTHLVVVGRDSVAQVWNLSRGTLEAQLRGHAQPVRALASNPQGNRLATVGEDSRLLVWDTTQGRLLHVWPAVSERVASLAYSSDGRLLAVAGGIPRIRVLDAQGGRLVQILTAPMADVGLAVFSADGRWLAGVSAASASGATNADTERSGRVALWFSDAQTRPYQDLPTSLLMHPGVRAVAFSADSRSLVSGGDDGVLRWWDLATGQSLRTFSAGPAGINAVAFVPGSSRTVMTGLQDHRVVFWDLLTGEKDVAIQDAAHDQ